MAASLSRQSNVAINYTYFNYHLHCFYVHLHNFHIHFSFQYSSCCLDKYSSFVVVFLLRDVHIVIVLTP